eukprot:s901_g9.t1
MVAECFGPPDESTLRLRFPGAQDADPCELFGDVSVVCSFNDDDGDDVVHNDVDVLFPVWLLVEEVHSPRSPTEDVPKSDSKQLLLHHEHRHGSNPLDNENYEAECQVLLKELEARKEEIQRHEEVFREQQSRIASLEDANTWGSTSGF